MKGKALLKRDLLIRSLKSSRRPFCLWLGFILLAYWVIWGLPCMNSKVPFLLFFFTDTCVLFQGTHSIREQSWQCLGPGRDLCGYLVHLGCCHKVPFTGWLVNNRTLFLAVLEPGSPSQGVSMVRLWWGLSSRLQTGDLSLYPHMLERGQNCSLESLLRH
jgi:hypothetical protein